MTVVNITLFISTETATHCCG